MSLIKERRLYNSLTPDQRRILEEKQIEGNYTPGEWLALLRQLAEYDRHGDAVRKVVKKMGCASGILVVATFIIGIVFETFFLFFIALIIGVVALVLYFVKKRSDLPNKLRRFALPLISILREEMEQGVPLYLRMDFRSGTIKEKETAYLGPDETKARYRRPSNVLKVKETHYTNAWMEGRARLTGGSILEWQIVDNTRQRKITKKGSSGKTKFKTKYKVKTIIDARLGLPREDYALMPGGPTAHQGEKVATRTGEKRNLIRVRRAKQSSTVDPEPDLKEFLDLVAGAFRRVTLTHTGENQL
ncbi:MAG: hypothetical protein L0229_20900 [Blastocatellia bacterium]|nr:hypothetical protein [Blastocatellia bacterium]